MAYYEDKLLKLYNSDNRQFAKSDAIIMEQHLGKNLIELELATQRNASIDVADEMVPVYFNRTKTPIKKMQKSIVYGEVCKYKEDFERIGIQDLNKVILTLTSLFNYSDCKEFTRLPNRVICKRNHLSRNTTNQIFFILHKSHILDVELRQNHIYVRFNHSFLKYDNYFKERCKKTLNQDLITTTEIKENNGSYYYDAYSYNTMVKHKRYDILGIAIAYTGLLGDKIYSEKRKEDLLVYGQREDIMYVEIPFHIISYATKIPISELKRYTNWLIKGASYMSKRDKTYESDIFDDCYYDENYKKCNLVDYKSAKENNDRLMITENSIIIYLDKFNNCRTGEYVFEHMEEYEQIVLNYMQQVLLQNILQDNDQLMINDIIQDNIINNSIEHKFDFAIKTNSIGEELYYEFTNNQSVIDLTKSHEYDHRVESFAKYIKVNFNNLSFNKAVYYTDLALHQNTLDDITRDRHKYNCKLIIKLLNYLTNFLNTLKSKCIDIKEYLDILIEKGYMCSIC